MNAEILAVGTELLMGQIVNSNAQYISKRLQDIGVNVYYHSVVGDNPARLQDCLSIALKRSDLVIMTGGLGPTQDDLTKETVAGVMGKKLVLHEQTLMKIEKMFQQAGWTMTDNNLKQAYILEGSTVMENNCGSAPGCIIENGGKILVMMPGPPSEMRVMFEQSVMPFLQAKSPEKIVSTYLNIFGIGESALEDMLLDLINKQDKTTIATYANPGQVTLRLTTKCGKDNAEDLNASVEAEIRRRLGNKVYSTGNTRLEEVVGALLLKSDVTISIVESFTGGLFTASLAKLPGITKVLKQSIITFEDGSPNKNKAVQSATDIMEKTNSDLGFAVLGSVDACSPENQEGYVYLALAAKQNNEVKTMEFKLTGNEDRKRNRTVLQALDMIRRMLE